MGGQIGGTWSRTRIRMLPSDTAPSDHPPEKHTNTADTSSDSGGSAVEMQPFGRCHGGQVETCA